MHREVVVVARGLIRERLRWSKAPARRSHLRYRAPRHCLVLMRPTLKCASPSCFEQRAPGIGSAASHSPFFLCVSSNATGAAMANCIYTGVVGDTAVVALVYSVPCLLFAMSAAYCAHLAHSSVDRPHASQSQDRGRTGWRSKRNPFVLRRDRRSSRPAALLCRC